MKLIDTIFVTSSTGFRKDFLKYNEHFFFYGHMSVATLAYAEDESNGLSMQRNTTEFRKQYQDARFYLLASEEFEKLDVEIGNEITEADLAEYDTKMHRLVFPP